jgi:tetratricopeptide (TPR) repeat protein
MFQSGRVDEARQLIEAACKQRPEDVDSMHLLATIQFAQKNPKAAIDLAKRASSLAPDHFFLWTSLCRWQVSVGEFHEAIATARQGLRINPFDEELHFFFGTALMKLSDPTNAVEHFRYSTALKPDSAEFHRQLAGALKSMGDFKEAIKEQETSAHLESDQSELLIELAALYTHESRHADAIKCYQSALDSNPFFMPARKGLAWLLATSPDPSIRKGKKALQIAGEACGSAGHKDPALEIVFAAAQAEEGLFQEAALTANKALALIKATNDKELIPLAEELLASFQSGRPCHQETAASRNFLMTP